MLPEPRAAEGLSTRELRNAVLLCLAAALLIAWSLRADASACCKRADGSCFTAPVACGVYGPCDPAKCGASPTPTPVPTATPTPGPTPTPPPPPTGVTYRVNIPAALWGVDAQGRLTIAGIPYEICKCPGPCSFVQAPGM